MVDVPGLAEVRRVPLPGDGDLAALLTHDQLLLGHPQHDNDLLSQGYCVLYLL